MHSIHRWLTTLVSAWCSGTGIQCTGQTQVCPCRHMWPVALGAIMTDKCAKVSGTATCTLLQRSSSV